MKSADRPAAEREIAELKRQALIKAKSIRVFESDLADLRARIVEIENKLKAAK